MHATLLQRLVQRYMVFQLRAAKPLIFVGYLPDFHCRTTEEHYDASGHQKDGGHTCCWWRLVRWWLVDSAMVGLC